MLNKLKKRTLQGNDNVVLVVILVISVLILSAAQPRFFSLGTMEGIAYQLPEMGILTMAMMITMLPGGINLSCIASANLSGILMAMIITSKIPKGEENIPVVLLAIFAGVLASVLAGSLNGIIIAVFEIPPMLVTLGMQMFLNGMALVITKGATISGYPRSFRLLGNGMIANIPIPIFVFVIALIILVFALRHMPFGGKIYVYGSNPTATEFSGINCKSLTIKTYALSGLFVGIAAVILTSRFNSAAAGYAETYLMQSLLIAVLGGVNPNGGSGKISGMVLSVVIIQVIASGLNILNISQYLITALYGLILLLAMVVRLLKSSKA